MISDVYCLWEGLMGGNVATAKKGRGSWANLFVIEGMYSILKQRTSLSVPIRAGQHS